MGKSTTRLTADRRLFLSNKFIIFLILLNAVVIFAEGFDISSPLQRTLLLADQVITTLFVFEAYVKISHFGWKKYWQDSWNRFDFSLVALSLPALFAFVLGINGAESLGALLVFRVLRLFKLFRLLRFVPEIDRLLSGMKRAMKASVIIIAGFAMYTFVLGVLSHKLFVNASPEHFGNPSIALYSTFKIFTIEGWFEIPDAVVANFSALATTLTYLYFILVLFSGGILGLSIVNSIFVEEMMSDNTNEIEEKIDALDKKVSLLLEQSKKG